MEAITIHPENKEQFSAIKAMLKAFKIPFEKNGEGDTYDPAFVEKIKKAEEDTEGTITLKTEEDINNYFNGLENAL